MGDSGRTAECLKLRKLKGQVQTSKMDPELAADSQAVEPSTVLAVLVLVRVLVPALQRQKVQWHVQARRYPLEAKEPQKEPKLEIETLEVGTLPVKVVLVAHTMQLLVERRGRQVHRGCIENLIRSNAGKHGCCGVYVGSKQHYNPYEAPPSVAGYQDDHSFQCSFGAGTQFEVAPEVGDHTI